METNAQISPSVPALVMLYLCYFILIMNNLIKTITLYFHTVLLSLFFSCLFVLFFDFLEKKKFIVEAEKKKTHTRNIQGNIQGK